MITREELETPRTAAAMLAWVDAAHARFRVSKELRDAARPGKYFANELVLEARPMALFALRYFDASSDVTIRHVIGDQSYDAIVEDRREIPGPIRYLEATTTLRNYADSLRMELLSRDGHAPAFGSVRAEGPRHNRRAITAEGGAHEHRAIRDERLARVREAVDRKAKKRYPPGTALIVAVDDATGFSEPEDLEALDLLARETLVPMARAAGFAMLALEGRNHAHLCYPI